MSEIEKITLIFTPIDQEEHPSPVKFVYKIEKGDYKKFADILIDFGGRKLTKREVRTIIKTYPDLDIDANEELTIEHIFEQSCIVDGITKLKSNVYEIDYST